MKIYYASQSFYPHIGGVSTYLLNLAEQMLTLGNKVIEVHLRPSGEVNQDDIKGIEIHRVPKEPLDEQMLKGYSAFKEAVYKESHCNLKEFAKPAKNMDGFHEFSQINEFFGKQIRELLEQNPADIVHIHDFQLLFAYKFVPRGTPLVLTWHIPFIPNMSKHLARFLVKQMKEYDKVVFSSQEYIDAAVKAGLPRNKAALIHPIANTNLFRKIDVNKAGVRKKYSIPKDAKVILSVQRIDPKSGHEQLIKAMPEIIRQVPDAKLVFVGSESMSNKISDEREKLNKKVKQLVRDLNLEKHVIFTGNIDYNNLPELYNSIDLVALCSKNEGFGLSITEGMACGNPVVGTKTGGIPIQVKDGENGFLVNIGDIKSTADRIIKILKDEKLRKSMADNSLKMVKNKFRMGIGIEKHSVLYNRIRRYKEEPHKIEHLKKSKVKAVITDLDRTITDKPPKAEFDPEDYDAALIGMLKNIGIDTFLATGRNIFYIKELCKKFGAWRCVIAENGAVLYFPPDGKTITIDTIAMKKAREIIKGLNLPGTTIGSVITSSRLQDEQLIRKKLGKLANELNFVKNVDEIMIMPSNVNKGMGIRLLMQYLNIDINKTIVIGDGENDVDMFLNPGFKVALSNAHKKLKNLADKVTREPSTEGVKGIITLLQNIE